MRTMLLAASLSLIALPAWSAPWKIDPASTLTFTGTQASEPFTGSFSKFTPIVEFDPSKPEQGTISVTVDMKSATIADSDKQESLPTSDWFFTEKFPTATFTSTSIAATGKDSFLAKGNLELRGVSKPIELPFSLRNEDGRTHAEGSVKLLRQDFGVGQGQWKDDQWIAFPVDVKFHLIATKQ